MRQTVATSQRVTRDVPRPGSSRAPATRDERPSAIDPDWSREACSWYRWDPGRQVLKGLRGYQRAVQGGAFGLLLSKLWVLHNRFWSVVAGCSIPLNSRLAGGLLLPHPNGIVLHPRAEVGPNCLLFQQVTLGTGPRPGTPVLEGHVDVGAGAKLLGGIHVGAHAVIGANAVVVTDVPQGARMVGIPARRIDDARAGDVES